VASVLYWLEIEGAAEAVAAYVQAPSNVLLQNQPLLMLPQMPAILEALADRESDSKVANRYREAGVQLRRSVEALPDFYYCEWISNCARILSEAANGDHRRNLEQAAECLRLAADRGQFTPGFGEAMRAQALFNQARMVWLLAQLGVDPLANLREVIRLYEEARVGFEDIPEALAQCLDGLAKAHIAAADLGGDAEEHLAAAVTLLEETAGLYKQQGESQLIGAIVLLAKTQVRLQEVRGIRTPREPA
jgi:hypothetical protein